MSTTMIKKLKAAGVVVPPLIQRVWQWLYDNGSHDSVSIASELDVPKNNSSSILGILFDRGMATRKSVPLPGGKERFVYSVNPKMKQYELLPLTEASKLRPKRGAAKKARETANQNQLQLFVQAGHANLPETIAKEVAAEPVAKPDILSILDTINVREAYQLHLALKAMFGNNKDNAQ